MNNDMLFIKCLDEYLKPYDPETDTGIMHLSPISVKVNVNKLKSVDVFSGALEEPISKVYRVLSLVSNMIVKKTNISDVAISALTGIGVDEIQNIMRNFMYRLDFDLRGRVDGKTIKLNTRVVTGIETVSMPSGKVVFYSIHNCPETKKDFQNILEETADAFAGLEDDE